MVRIRIRISWGISVQKCSSDPGEHFYTEVSSFYRDKWKVTAQTRKRRKSMYSSEWGKDYKCNYRVKRALGLIYVRPMANRKRWVEWLCRSERIYDIWRGKESWMLLPISWFSLILHLSANSSWSWIMQITQIPYSES